MIAEFPWRVEQIAVLGAFAIPIAAIIAYYWYRATAARANAGLKQTLAKRGMSAEEIERVIRAGEEK